MALTLGPQLQNLIDERVKSGKYASAEDVVAAAMASLDQQERFGDFEAGELDELLREGERSIEQEGNPGRWGIVSTAPPAPRATSESTTMKYRISRRAEADIERICDYIAKADPDAAESVDERIHDAIKLLARQAPGYGA
jgi:putative addiction module CopG family antidote